MGLQRVSNDWATFTFTILKLGNFTLEIWISGFPDSSAGKESACNAGDPCSIPGTGRSPGEGTGYLLQYARASLVAQMNTSLKCRNKWQRICLQIQETWIQFLSWEDPLEEGMATHSSILAWRIPMDRGTWWATVHGVVKRQTRLSN